MPRRRDTRDRPLVMESLENPRKVVGKTGDGNSGKTGDLTAGVFLHGDRRVDENTGIHADF